MTTWWYEQNGRTIPTLPPLSSSLKKNSRGTCPMNLSTSVLEIRPLDKLWQSSPENWNINCIPGRYRMRKGRGFLMNIRSPAWGMVLNLMKPLDSPQITLSPVDSNQTHSPLRLSVDIPTSLWPIILRRRGWGSPVAQHPWYGL